jgi:hypothetical protein
MHWRSTITLALAALAFTTLHAQRQSSPSQPSRSAIQAGPWVDAAPPALSTKTPRTEDWTALALSRSELDLSSSGGAIINKVELFGCTRELVRMQWRPNDPIELYVIRPSHKKRPPVSLYLYNYTTDTDLFRDDAWCTQSKQSGVAVAGFVSALAGQRFHSPRPMKQWFVSEMQEALATSTHDVQMVLNYLDSRGDLDMKHVGMFGQGSGGSIAILAAAVDPRILAVDVLDPWGDWSDWIRGSRQIPEEERAAYLDPEFLQKISVFDPVLYIPQLKLKAFHLEQVMTDPVTPATAQTKLAEATPRQNLIRYEDAAAQAKAWARDGLSEWLGKQLTMEQP